MKENGSADGDDSLQGPKKGEWVINFNYISFIFMEHFF